MLIYQIVPFSDVTEMVQVHLAFVTLYTHKPQILLSTLLDPFEPFEG